MARYKLVNGVKVQFTAEEETLRDAEELEWSNGVFDRAMEDLRAKRNRFLAETDFYALSDLTMSDEMKNYRQELRDLTNGLTTAEQVEAVIWPTKPGT